MSKRKDYDDDDGRTVADMSEIGQPSLFPKLPKREKNEAPEKKDELYLTKREKTFYILGTLKSALLIGAVFAVAFALLIVVMLLIWEMK